MTTRSRWKPPPPSAPPSRPSSACVPTAELAEAPDHATAFTAYERRLRDYVELNQEQGRAAARWFFEQSAEPPAEVAEDTVPLKQYA
ncbi:hypothetical protein ACFPZ0_28340 [Streptomonospora nanhaiensis]|uniref:hypothetical protein n=1 Tax=Streptomonospora nanhaiensis TaxID=1323731 RepID=UPI00360C5D50